MAGPRLTLALGALALLMCSCASIPAGQYGVRRLEWEGTRAIAPAAIESCLVTRERPRASLMLGLGAPTCGVPPFDASPPTIHLWSWPWSDWPLYDSAIFEVERERIERYYQARGFYDARVTGVRTYVGKRQVDPEECKGQGAACELKIVVAVKEGQPTYVERMTLTSREPLPERLMRRLRAGLQLTRGQRLDESVYNADKALLSHELLEASYARAIVTGHVIIDRERRQAYVEYHIEPGPECVFGNVLIEGADKDVPMHVLVQTANIPKGRRFDQDRLEDAQRALIALNVFSSVRTALRGQGRVVDVALIVQRGKVTQVSAGVGIQSGTMVRATSGEAISVPQWDVHLSGSYDNRNFLGGLRRLRIEERPRLISLHEFPIASSGFRPGNIVSLRFEQPAALEARTKLLLPADWDYGPDPFLGFFRHDIRVKLGLERYFFRQRLLARVHVGHDFYSVTESKADTPEGVSSYKLPYLEQQLIVDLRNDARRPRKGVYASFLIQEAARLGYGSWDYIRMLPDLRAYVPLPLGSVLAVRFALAALVVLDADHGLDDKSQRLGPQGYRLRGGGANSNRGFLAGRLGDSTDGGTRRWESSVELRVPVGESLGAVLFADAGDVSDVKKPRFRFSHLNTALGFGLRYYSVIGALRLDAAWRVPGLQVLSDEPAQVDHASGAWPSAVHLTIGEAF